MFALWRRETGKIAPGNEVTSTNNRIEVDARGDWTLEEALRVLHAIRSLSFIYTRNPANVSSKAETLPPTLLGWITAASKRGT